MKLSIVTTLYQAAPYLETFFHRMVATADQITDAWELLLVNDGSSDDSLERALALQRAHTHVVVIDLSRNFGQHQAIMTGLAHAKGERIFLIDCDLEEPPELLVSFDQMYRDKDVDVVYGVQARRKGRLFERVSGDLFFRLFNWLAQINLPRNVVLARLMSRRYVNALLEHGERELFFVGICMITGFKQWPVTVHKGSKGTTTYSLSRKLALFANATTSFSNRPLIFIFYVGLAISLVSSLYILFLLIRKTFFLLPVSGWTSLIVSIWFLGGLIILFLGIMGIYLSRIFSEVKQRPRTIIRKIYDQDA